MTCLIGMTVTPVQRFIREARKTQDLWSGSLLLSLMGLEMIKALEGKGADIIFPYISVDSKGPPSVTNEVRAKAGAAAARHQSLGPPSVTNEVRAKVDLDQQMAAQLAVATEQAVQTWWQGDVAKTVRDKLIKLDLFKEVELSLWEKQIAGQFRIVWAVYPLDTNNAATMAHSYRALTQLLSAAKQARLVEGYRGGPQHKCTLSGELEVMGGNTPKFWSDEFPTRLRNAGNHEDAKAIRARIDVDGREQLSTVSLTKRLAPVFAFAPRQGWSGRDVRSPLRFPSTTAIAWGEQKARIVEVVAQNQGHPPFTRILNAFARQVKQCARSGNEVEGIHWLPWFDETLLPLKSQIKRAVWRFLRLDGVWLNPPDPSQIAAAGVLPSRQRAPADYRALSKTCSELQREIERFAPGLVDLTRTPPLAVIRADADHLGKQLETAIETQGFARGRALSQLLAETVMVRVTQAIEGPYRGRVVFAGGDECLVLVPAIFTLDAAETIAQAYQEAGQQGGFPGLTCSVAAVIVSAHRPLRQAVEDVGRLLEEAKQHRRLELWRPQSDEINRHAFGLAIIPGSGNEKRAVIGLEIPAWRDRKYIHGDPIRAISAVLKPLCELLTIPAESGIRVSSKLFRDWLALFTATGTGASRIGGRGNSWVDDVENFYPRQNHDGILIAELQRIIGRHIQVDTGYGAHLEATQIGDRTCEQWLSDFINGNVPANDPEALTQALSAAITDRIMALMKSGGPSGNSEDIPWGALTGLLLAITTLGTREMM